MGMHEENRFADPAAWIAIAALTSVLTLLPSGARAAGYGVGHESVGGMGVAYAGDVVVRENATHPNISI